MFNNRAEARQRFSLRKLTVGVVSVLLGLTFLTYNGENVHADTNSASAQPKAEEVSSSSSKGDIAEKATAVSKNANQAKAPVESANVETKDATQKAEVKSSTPQVADKVSVTQDANKTEDKTDNTAQQEKTGDEDQSKLTSSFDGRKVNLQQGQGLKSDNKSTFNPSKVSDDVANGNQKTTNKQISDKPNFSEAQIRNAFELDEPDLNDDQLHALGIDRNTYLINGVKYKVLGTFDVYLDNGQTFYHLPFHVNHHADGSFQDLYFDHANIGVRVLNMGIYPKKFGYNYAYAPIAQGKEIWVNKGTKQLNFNDAERGLPKEYQKGYKNLVWNLDPKASNLDLNKAGDYHAVVEITYKNDLGVSTGVNVHVVDLQGKTITGIIGKDIDTKMQDVDAHPDKYINGAPTNSTSFIWLNYPDTTHVTEPDKPATGKVRVTYPDGNYGDAIIYVNVTDPTTTKDITVPVTRTIHFGYWDGSKDNLANWHTMEPDVKQTINLKYKVEVNSKGNIVNYIGWEPNQNATLPGVNWININGWHPSPDHVDPQSNKHYAAAPATPVDLTHSKYIAGYNYNCYAAYEKNTYTTRTIASKEVVRRIHFVDVDDKTGYIYPPMSQYLTFNHNVRVDQYGHQVADLGWQAYDGKGLATFATVPWKDLTQNNWYKYNVDVKNAADAYTVLASDVAKNPAEVQYIDVYAQYVSPHIERLTDQRIVHFGHYKNQGPHDGSQGTFDKNHRPIDWEDLTDPVTQNIEVDVYEYTTSDHITHFIKYMSANPTHFDPVEWKYIKGWYHVSGDTYAAPTKVIKSVQIDLNGKPENTDVIYREYAEDTPQDKVIGSKYILRRVYFGYFGDGKSIKEIPKDVTPTDLNVLVAVDPGHRTSTTVSHEWHTLADPETQFLVFYHHQITYHDPRNGQTKDYWQAYDGNTLKPIPWKDIKGWTKAYDSKYAAGSRTFDDIEKDIADVPQNNLIWNVYAPYIKNAKPTNPVQPSQPTKPAQPTNKPTSPTQPTNQPNQPTTIPPKPPVNPTTPSSKPTEPTRPNQPSNVRPKPVKPVRPAKPQSSNVKPKPETPSKSRTTKPIAQKGNNNGRTYGYRYVPKTTSSKSYSGVSNASALKACNKVLPHTGNKGSGIIAAIGAAFAAVAGFFGLAGRRRKRF